MEQDAPETVFYLPKRLTGSGLLGRFCCPVTDVTSASIRGIYTTRWSFLRHMRALSDG
jgi:hypothetical protein